MAVDQPPTFERLLVGLDDETFTAFVADIWTAQGSDAQAVGPNQVVADFGQLGERTILTIRWHSRLALRFRLATADLESSKANIIVSNRDDHRLETLAAEAGMEYVGPDRLREVLLYALERDHAESLFRSYFDQSIATLTSTERDNPRNTGFVSRFRHQDVGLGNLSFSATPDTVAVTFVIALCAVLVVGLGASPILEGAILGSSASQGEDVDRADDPRYPPSIAAVAEGQFSPLLDRHRNALPRKSFSLTIKHNRTHGSLVTSGRWQWSIQRMHVDSGRHLSIEVDGALAPTTIGTDPRPVAFAIVRNASTCTIRGDWHSTRLGEGNPCALLSNQRGRAIVAMMTTAYVRRYLNGTNPSIQPIGSDSNGAFRIESRHPPPALPARFSMYRAVAIVDSRGLIRAMRVTAETANGSASDMMTFVYVIENLSAPSDVSTDAVARGPHPHGSSEASEQGGEERVRLD